MHIDKKLHTMNCIMCYSFVSWMCHYTSDLQRISFTKCMRKALLLLYEDRQNKYFHPLIDFQIRESSVCCFVTGREDHTCSYSSRSSNCLISWQFCHFRRFSISCWILHHLCSAIALPFFSHTLGFPNYHSTKFDNFCTRILQFTHKNKRRVGYIETPKDDEGFVYSNV